MKGIFCDMKAETPENEAGRCGHCDSWDTGGRVAEAHTSQGITHFTLSPLFAYGAARDINCFSY